MKKFWKLAYRVSQFIYLYDFISAHGTFYRFIHSHLERKAFPKAHLYIEFLENYDVSDT